jgi:hypothetical protein
MAPALQMVPDNSGIELARNMRNHNAPIRGKRQHKHFVRRLFNNTYAKLLSAVQRMDPVGRGGRLAFSLSMSSAAVDNNLTILTSQTMDLKARSLPCHDCFLVYLN